MLTIGSRIQIRKTGNQATGIVEGFVTAECYLNSMGRNQFNLWDNLYPDWKNDLIVFIKYDEPQKNVTIEEIFDFLPEGYCYKVAEYIYYEQVPLSTRCATPISDVVEV